MTTYKHKENSMVMKLIYKDDDIAKLESVEKTLGTQPKWQWYGSPEEFEKEWILL